MSVRAPWSAIFGTIALFAIACGALGQSSAGEDSLGDSQSAEERTENNVSIPEGDSPIFAARKSGQSPEAKPGMLEEEEEEERPVGQKGQSGRADSLETPTDEEAEGEKPRKEEVHDVLHWRPDRGEPRDMPIVLYPEYLTFPVPAADRDKPFEFQPWTASGRVKQTLPGRQIVGIEYYEDRLGGEAAHALGLASLAALAAPGTRVDPSRDADAYRRAEQLLRTALAEHDSAVERKLRQGAAWDEKVRKPLVAALANLHLGRVDQLIRAGRYEQAQAECDRLADELGPSGPARDEVRRYGQRILEAQAQAALDNNDYPAARRLLDQAAAQSGGTPIESVARLQKRLIDRAAELSREAERLQQDRPEEAIRLLDEAMRVWPALPGLDQRRRRLIGDYPILHCAYPELPRSLSPLEARTPVERHAASLVYESLVHWVDDPVSGPHYERRLAEAGPFAVERGRGFLLPHCFWPAGDGGHVACTVEDVRWSVKLLVDRGRPGYSPAMARLIEGVQGSAEGDPRMALVTFRRDHWQPLSLMDFPVLPHPGPSAEQDLASQLARLRQNAAGTGPYRSAPGDDPDMLRLVANPLYRKAGLPRIREIVFHRLDPTAAQDLFLQGRIHLIYGVPPEQAVELRDQGRQVVCLKTPSVWFLAPNYRRPALRSRNLRLAVAHAIRRREIIDQCFRAGAGADDHAVLTGPYPAESWACSPDVSLFDPRDDAARELEAERARTLAELARKELGTSDLSLDLLYPEGDAQTRQACEQIRAQASEVGIALRLVPLATSEFYRRVVDEHEFDLAYWRHDFDDPTYWIEPLVDQDPEARRPGGPNFMGYTQDETTAGLFAELRLHKHFPQVRQVTHRIHEQVARNGVLIPLWQLGTYVAISRSVHPKDRHGNAITLDPFDPFGNVEHWELEAGRE